jgi:hypothetical protein
MATKNIPPGPPAMPPEKDAHAGGDLELLKVIVTREGQRVTAQWAIHPQMKSDLQPEEWTQLTELMTKVTGLVGNRFAEILTDNEPDHPGTA